MTQDQDDDSPEPSRRGALLAILVVLVLVGCAWWAMSALRGAGAVQDCVMAGRSNCAPIR